MTRKSIQRNKRTIARRTTVRAAVRPTRQRAPRTAFTLLEVILALALSVVLLAAIMSAIYLHLSVLDKRRGKIERAQLARSVMQTMAGDIRSAVQYKPIDVSQLQAMMAGGDITSLMGTPGGNAMIDEALESGIGDDAGSDAGGGLDLNNGFNMLGGSNPFNTGGADDGLADTVDLGAPATEDIAGTIAPPTEPGIYGNQYELQVDTSKLPRKDQYNPLLTSTGSVSSDIPSDIKSIAYFMQQSGQPSDAIVSELDTQVTEGGLVRRQIDRAVARYAQDFGGELVGLGRTEVIAAEVTRLEFRYFDGTDWVPEWDSEAVGALPMAIEIVMVLSELDEDGIPVPFESEAAMISSTYRLVVHLPIAEAAMQDDPLLSDDPTMDAGPPPADNGSSDSPGADGGSDGGTGGDDSDDR